MNKEDVNKEDVNDNKFDEEYSSSNNDLENDAYNDSDYRNDNYGDDENDEASDIEKSDLEDDKLDYLLETDVEKLVLPNEIEKEKENAAQQSVSYFSIVQSIPPDATSAPNQNLIDSGLTEWRWRFFKINSKPVVEISYKISNQIRQYFDKAGKTTDHEPSSYYDQFVTNELYYYAKN